MGGRYVATIVIWTAIRWGLVNIVNLLFEGLVSEKIKQLVLNGNWVIHKASVKYYALKTTVVVWKII